MLSVALIGILTPLGLSLLLRYFSLRHQKIYLHEWSLFWVWLGIFELLSWLVLVSTSGIPLTRPDRLILAMAAATAMFLAIAHLMAGSFNLLQRRPIRTRIFRRMRIALIAAGVASVLGLAFLGSNHESVFGSTSSLLIVIAYIGTAVTLARRRNRESATWILLVITLAASGLAEMVFRFLDRALIGSGIAFDVPEVAAVGAFFHIMLALAMLVRMLDDERLAALSAASQVAHMVYHEDLTGLANRALFLDRLIMAQSQAERRGRRLAVLFLDIDRFKTINDSLGHSVGDALLKRTAERIRSAVRAEDTVARFGGDEFVVLMPDLKAAEDTGIVAKKLIDAVRSPFIAEGHEMAVTTSVGIAVYPEDGRDAETLMTNADTAMYQAKEQGGDRFRLYSVSMNHRTLEKLELEMGLKRGLEFRQFELHYQPLVDVATETVVGMEALLRWDHPTMGLLLPEHFLPAAERSGMIVSIGEWAFREICRQAVEWNRSLDRELQVSINLSVEELMQEDLVERVMADVLDVGIHPGQIDIEITESAAFEGIEETMKILERLRKSGFRIAIDDIGSGHSNLGLLKTMPLDTLKIDRILIGNLEDERDAAITAGLITIAHSMGLKVVAEGVETAAQLAFLRERFCERFQGKLFSEALPADLIVSRVNQSSAPLRQGY